MISKCLHDIIKSILWKLEYSQEVLYTAQLYTETFNNNILYSQIGI